VPTAACTPASSPTRYLRGEAVQQSSCLNDAQGLTISPQLASIASCVWNLIVEFTAAQIHLLPGNFIIVCFGVIAQHMASETSLQSLAAIVVVPIVVVVCVVAVVVVVVIAVAFSHHSSSSFCVEYTSPTTGPLHQHPSCPSLYRICLGEREQHSVRLISEQDFTTWSICA